MIWFQVTGHSRVRTSVPSSHSSWVPSGPCRSVAPTAREPAGSLGPSAHFSARCPQDPAAGGRGEGKGAPFPGALGPGGVAHAPHEREALASRGPRGPAGLGEVRGAAAPEARPSSPRTQVPASAPDVAEEAAAATRADPGPRQYLLRAEVPAQAAAASGGIGHSRRESVSAGALFSPSRGVTVAALRRPETQEPAPRPARPDS